MSKFFFYVGGKQATKKNLKNTRKPSNFYACGLGMSD